MKVGSKLPRNLLHLRGVVAFGIDGDVHHLHVRRVRAQLLARARERRERDRADLAAIAEAEGQQHHLAAKALEIERPAIRALQA